MAVVEADSQDVKIVMTEPTHTMTTVVTAMITGRDVTALPDGAMAVRIVMVGIVTSRTLMTAPAVVRGLRRDMAATTMDTAGVAPARLRLMAVLRQLTTVSTFLAATATRFLTFNSCSSRILAATS